MELIINSNLDKVGFVIPTLGQRVDFLKQCIYSIQDAGCKTIYLVTPKNKITDLPQISELCSVILEDPGKGLPEAINFGISALPDSISYVAWLGDDDLLTKDSVRNSLKVLETQSDVVATYGACAYVDENSNQIFLNKSGRWAAVFMNFLPNLIPQPGSIFRRSAFVAVGGVRGRFPLSFDFELFFKLKKIGHLHYIPKVQSQFRWHSNSLSVDQRHEAVRQTSKIRKEHLPRSLKPFSFTWEPLIMLGTLVIGKVLDLRTKKSSK